MPEQGRRFFSFHFFRLSYDRNPQVIFPFFCFAVLRESSRPRRPCPVSRPFTAASRRCWVIDPTNTDRCRTSLRDNTICVYIVTIVHSGHIHNYYCNCVLWRCCLPAKPISCAVITSLPPSDCDTRILRYRWVHVTPLNRYVFKKKINKFKDVNNGPILLCYHLIYR